eukprot:TRINITY_DN15056_c0_g1_i3.p1 TRINITY_DN15056_c0_g1~~TRINITY_DN15056_c0_g1_i3.p1  ORF type:complete len:654 (-),score=73.84 TRINITY_DN15056_c0_g1_i3:31-1992(-)
MHRNTSFQEGAVAGKSRRLSFSDSVELDPYVVVAGFNASPRVGDRFATAAVTFEPNASFSVSRRVDPLSLYPDGTSRQIADMVKAFIFALSRHPKWLVRSARRLIGAVRVLQMRWRGYSASKQELLGAALRAWEHRERRLQAKRQQDARQPLTPFTMWTEYLHTAIPMETKREALLAYYNDRWRDYVVQVWRPWKKRLAAGEATIEEQPFFNFVLLPGDLQKVIDSVSDRHKRRGSAAAMDYIAATTHVTEETRSPLVPQVSFDSIHGEMVVAAHLLTEEEMRQQSRRSQSINQDPLRRNRRSTTFASSLTSPLPMPPSPAFPRNESLQALAAVKDNPPLQKESSSDHLEPPPILLVPPSASPVPSTPRSSVPGTPSQSSPAAAVAKELFHHDDDRDKRSLSTPRSRSRQLSETKPHTSQHSHSPRNHYSSNSPRVALVPLGRVEHSVRAVFECGEEPRPDTPPPDLEQSFVQRACSLSPAQRSQTVTTVKVSVGPVVELPRFPALRPPPSLPKHAAQYSVAKAWRSTAGKCERRPLPPVHAIQRGKAFERTVYMAAFERQSNTAAPRPGPPVIPSAHPDCAVPYPTGAIQSLLPKQPALPTRVAPKPVPSSSASMQMRNFISMKRSFLKEATLHRDAELRNQVLSNYVQPIL